jgi:hypothetical protein
MNKDTCCSSCSCTRGPALWLVLIAVAIAVGASLWPHKPAGTDRAEPATAPSTNAGPAEAEAKTALQFLKGRWLRPDGGYVLEIRQVDADGQLDAGYFNPNPIRVVSAKATKDGAAVKVYVELNDVNYPGCKYNLTYLPDQKQLVGTYFQAAMQQTFEVAFEREQ